MLRIYAEALDRLRVRLNMYLVILEQLRRLSQERERRVCPRQICPKDHLTLDVGGERITGFLFYLQM